MDIDYLRATYCIWVDGYQKRFLEYMARPISLTKYRINWRRK